LEVLIDGQDGSPGESYASENFAAQEVTILPVSRQTGDPSSLFQKASTRPPPRIPWGGWSTGYGMGGFAQGNHGAAGGIFGTGGTVACAERFLDEHTAMGFYGAYANMSVRTVDDIDQGASFDEGMFGSYFIHHSEHSYLLTAGTMGFAGFRELRRVDTSPFRLTAKGNYNGWNPSAYIERGVHIPIGQTIITPFGALQYIYVRQNPFVETGAGALNLAVAGTDTPAFRSILASRITRVCYLKNGWFVAPEVRAGWVHEFLNPVTTVNSTFAPIGGPTFPTRGLNLGRDSMITGGGMQLWLTHRLSLYAQYDLNFNTYQAWHAGSGGFQFGW
jgi:outer membrane autotransporter protein